MERQRPVEEYAFPLQSPDRGRGKNGKFRPVCRPDDARTALLQGRCVRNERFATVRILGREDFEGCYEDYCRVVGHIATDKETVDKYLSYVSYEQYKEENPDKF